MKTYQKMATLVAVLTGLLSFSVTSSATDELGLFELEGNAIDDTLVPGDDWDTVLLNGGGASLSTTGLVVDDPLSSIFTQGGSKDVLNIDKWRWKNGSVPDKDDITNAYAAGYLDDGDLLIYVGADRFANNGDAVMGLWLFQDEVSLNPIGGDSVGTFNGEHKIGDVLAVAEFSNGGQDVDVVLYQWAGFDGKKGSLVKIDLPAVQCGSGDFHLGCAITNINDEISPWDYTPKDGEPNVFPPVSFFEGGFNISEMAAELGFQVPCFSSFMVQSRSSTSLTAQLKDFVIGNFDTCSLDITKTCPSGEVNATETAFVYNYEGTITNSGFGTLYDAIVIDNAGTPADTSDDIVHMIGDLASGQAATYSGSFETQENPPTNSAQAFARSAASALERTVISDPASDLCPRIDKDPNIYIDKACETYLDDSTGLVVVGVSFSGKVCNTGDIGLNNITVSESNPGVSFSDPITTSLAVDACDNYAGTYMPTSADSNPGIAAFTNTITVSADAPLGFGSAISEPATATCKLCVDETT